MDYRTSIQQCIDYIEDNIHQPPTAAELAQLAGFSLYHFYKVFHVNTGLPVMEYIRRRRLAHAAAELAGPGRVIEIALAYGFETHAGFTKAFRKTYGMTPEKYRMHATGRVPEKVDLAKLAGYQLNGGIVMRPTFVTKPAMKLAGYALKTTSTEGENSVDIPKFWDRYFDENWAHMLHEVLRPVHHAELGACIMDEEAQDYFTYLIGVEVADLNDLPEGIYGREIPAATYAVFTTPAANRADRAFTKAIQGTTEYIYNEWFPNSGYEYAPGGVDFEWYDERSHGDHDLVMDIYVPVVKKA